MLQCLHVVLKEEWRHHRYAVRDLEVLENRRSLIVRALYPSTSCWPPSMSKVAPVTAVLVMR